MSNSVTPTLTTLLKRNIDISVRLNVIKEQYHVAAAKFKTLPTNQKTNLIGFEVVRLGEYILDVFDRSYMCKINDVAIAAVDKEVKSLEMDITNLQSVINNPETLKVSL